MGRMLIILVVTMAGLFSTINFNIVESNSRMMRNAITEYNRVQAKNLAASGIEMAIMELRQDTLWTGKNIYAIGGGGLNVNASSTNSIFFNGPNAGISGRLIQSVGTVQNESDTIRAVVQIETSGSVAAARAAITTNNPVTTLGNLQVDGREHDMNGNLIANSGTLAISTTQTVSVGGSSDVSGTYSGADEGPHDKFDDYSNVVEENASWENGFPTTPDEVMGGTDEGYPEGKLKSIAASGVNGSQYVTDPEDLTFPLSGVTYVEISDAEKAKDRTYKSMDFGNYSSGILVVHNSSTNAIIKNLNGGIFKGLIIADDIVHIHCDIIGAIIGLTSDPSEGNCIGNGSGNVKYCSAAISAASGVTGVGGSTISLDLVSWYE